MFKRESLTRVARRTAQILIGKTTSVCILRSRASSSCFCTGIGQQEAVFLQSKHAERLTVIATLGECSEPSVVPCRRERWHCHGPVGGRKRSGPANASYSCVSMYFISSKFKNSMPREPTSPRVVRWNCRDVTCRNTNGGSDVALGSLLSSTCHRGNEKLLWGQSIT